MRTMKGLWKGRNGYWYYQLTLKGGKRIQRSTRTRNYTEARETYLAALEAAQRGELVEKSKAPTVREYLGTYIASLEAGGRKRSTVRSARYSLRHVLSCFGDTPLDAITHDALDGYKQKRLDAGVSPYSINRELRALKGLLNRARKGGLVEKLPSGLDLLSTDALPEPEPYTAEERDALISKPSDPRARAYFLLVFGAGLRRQEVCWLEWADFEELEGCGARVHIRPKEDGGEAWSPKNRQRRAALLDQETWVLLNEYKLGLDVKSSWVIPGRAGERFRNPTKLLRQAAQEAGVYRKGKLIHAARHTFGTSMAQIAPLRDVQKLMGHSSILVTEKYLHPDERLQREAVEKAGFGKAAREALRAREGAQVVPFRRV